MNIKLLALNSVQKLLGLFGWRLTKKWNNNFKPIMGEEALDSLAYLTPSNERLQGIIKNYTALEQNITSSRTWDWRAGSISTEFLQNFRGDRAFVWQMKGLDMPEIRYLLTTYYTMANDKLQLFDRLSIDSVFGNAVFKIHNRLVSRELLDSINEINFLDRELSISSIENLKILDIGSGYGRLAHRCSEALANLNTYYCTDGVPSSAFLCDFYLRYRNISKGKMVEMGMVENELKDELIHLAVNIHSFSECSMDSIEWWISLVRRLDIRYILIIPNAYEDGGNRLLNNERENFQGIIEKNEYRLILKTQKYADPLVQQFGLYPTCYYLFEKV
jgi:hypothetical protein